MKPYTLILILYALTLTLSQQLVLSRYGGSKTQDKLVHTLPISINDGTFKVRIDLNQQKSWIKSSACKACVNLECKQSCEAKLGPTKEGLKCQSPSCTSSSNTYSENNVEGVESEIEIKIGKEFEKSINMVLINKVKFSMDNFTKQYDGVLNILEEPEIFDEFTISSRDKKLYLGVNEQLNEKYLDLRDEAIKETLQSDGGMSIEGIQIGSESITSDNKGYFDVNTKSLHLPEEEFKKLKEKVEEMHNQCQLQSGILKCPSSSEINKVKELVFALSFGANKLQLPFTVFIDSCKSKECQIFIKETEEDKIVLGEVIFLAFGVHVQTSDRTITFHRLKNTFSTKFHELAGVRAGSSVSESGSFFSYFGSFFLFFFKIIVVLGILALSINLYYNKTHVTRWIRNRTHGQESHYSPAFAEDIQNAGVLHGYDPKNASKQFWEENTVDGI